LAGVGGDSPVDAAVPLEIPHKVIHWPFGVTSAQRPVWSQHLNAGNAQAVEYMLSTPLFARVIGLSLVQSTKVAPAFIAALPGCPPQCDIAYLMCRQFDKQWDPILRGWAAQNGSVFTDYLTLCRVKGFPVPTARVPELTPEQQRIYDTFAES
jgi:hypothetical protein